MKLQETIHDSIDVINDFSPHSELIHQEYFNEPVIQKLLRQQEELNRFKDISNPGISYGFFHFPQALINTIDE
ncbi:MAG: hypothetical protein F3745_03615 [Nitrospinae bacterium]|nr:hypothetical protein [Nitrospinota bacterium]